MLARPFRNPAAAGALWLVAAACAVDLGDEPEIDGAAAPFPGGKADGGIDEGSPEAIGVLRVANEADRAALIEEVALQARAADNLLAERPFASLAHLDAVPYVGPIALARLLDHARASGLVPAPGVRVVRAAAVADIPADPPAAGTYRVHVIDVGSGLAILIQGGDFTMLFDGGSTDDRGGITAAGNRSRLLAYLFAALGPSGPPACVPDGDDWPLPAREVVIDHLVLSHPHEDHSSMLDEVLRCYRVRHVWDAGVVNDTATHAEFLAAVAAEPAVRYHTAAPVPASRTVRVFGRAIAFPAALPWTRFAAGDRRTLGDGASFRVLHVDGTYYPNQFNQNSIVLRVDLGATSLLLAADAESGVRAQPSGPLGDVEAILVEQYPDDLDVDVLQVGHHGSLTSSRLEFLRAVSPDYALISAGPTLNNGGVRLPEAATLTSLATVGARTLRTDAHDDECPDGDRVGIDDARPGGCDNYLLEIAPPIPD